MRPRSAAMFGLVFSTALLAQGDNPHVGTWKANVAKSRYTPGTTVTRSTIKIEAAGMGIKVSVDTVDLPTTGGSRWLAGRRPARDAAVVAAARRAGAVVLAKTATFELGCGDERTPFGVVHNPHDLACATGGSSAGSAASGCRR